MVDDNLYILSEYGMVFENPPEDIKEKLRLLKEEIMIKYEILSDKYIKRRYKL